MKRAARTIERGRKMISVTPSKTQTEEDIQKELERSAFHLAERVEEGTEEWRLTIHRRGSLRIAWNKEVGPPPWRWPRIGPIFSRKPPTITFVAGWHLTAYRFTVMWSKPKSKQQGKT